MSTHIKICGIRTPDVAAAAVEAGADMVGVVFVERSPRLVTLDEARAVAAAVSGRAEVVGLFKDASLDRVRQTAGRVPLSMLQLHGALAPADVPHLRPTRWLRAVSFDPQTIEADLRAVDNLSRANENLAAVIIDTPDPSQVGGGTGRAFDWPALRQVLDRLQPRTRVVLAGGLTPDNVAEAIAAVRPWMVDVSSGVESRRGEKDAALIQAFCEAARSAASGD